jgi:hypothetical protein
VLLWHGSLRNCVIKNKRCHEPGLCSAFLPQYEIAIQSWKHGSAEIQRVCVL